MMVLLAILLVAMGLHRHLPVIPMIVMTGDFHLLAIGMRLTHQVHPLRGLEVPWVAALPLEVATISTGFLPATTLHPPTRVGVH